MRILIIEVLKSVILKINLEFLFPVNSFFTGCVALFPTFQAPLSTLWWSLIICSHFRVRC